MAQNPPRNAALDNYVPVAERIEQFYTRFNEGRILTSIVEHDRETGFIIVRAEIYRNPDDATPAATGHAYEYKDAGYVQRGSYIEVAECVPLDTEILTLEGWRAPEDLRVGELVLSYDIGNDEMVWTPVERISFFRNQPVVRMYNGKGFEVFCTPNHTWTVENKVRQEQKCYVYRKLRKTTELKTADGIIGSAPMKGGFLQTSPRDAAHMGWAITDGWFQRSTPNQFRIGIGQSKPKTVGTIRELLTGIPCNEIMYPAYTRTFPTGRTYECLPSYHWQLSSAASRNLLAAFGIAHESELPRVVPQLSFEARAAMLEAMMLGDGTERGVFGTKNRPWVMDVFAMLAALQGYVALKRRLSSIGDVPIQTLKRTARIWASRLQFEDVGRTDVWCPTVRFGTWVARFSNGVTMITGNTSAVGRALAFLNFETKRGIASREEMEKFTRSEQRGEAATATTTTPSRENPDASEDARAASRARLAAVTPAPAVTGGGEQTRPARAADSPATDDQKEEILILLEEIYPNDRRAQKRALTDATSKQSRDDLTQTEARRFLAELKKRAIP